MGKKKRKETIVECHKDNFETLRRAFKDEAVCLMDCVEKASGEHVAVICATTLVKEGGKELYKFVPFARFFNGNPFELLMPPMEHGEEVVS